MAGPWEKYATTSDSDGPWAKYARVSDVETQGPPPESRMERIGHGLMDPIYGAAQIGARMPEQEGESLGYAIMGGEAPEARQAARQQTVDKAVIEREKAIQARRPADERGSFDVLRAAGSVPTSALLSAPAMAVGGPVAAGVASGAMGAMLQPETDVKNFGTQKAIEAATGGIAGGVLGGVIKGAGIVYQAFKNPTAKGLAELTRAAERDGTTLEKLQQRLTEARVTRPDATLADVAGENVRGLVERIGQTPGAGQAKLVPRIAQHQKEQLERLRTDLSQLGDVGRTAVQATEQTMAQRASAATPLYRQAYEDGDRVIWNTSLERLTAAREVETAMHTAVARWQTSAIADGYGAMNPGAIVRGEGRTGVLDFEGGRVPVFPNLQFWDYTKKALDGMVGEALKNNQRQYARDLTRIAQMLRDQLDLEIPSYQAARAAWAGPTQYLNAIELGRGIMTENAEQMAADFAQLSPHEQEGFRVGAVSALRNAMGDNAAKLADFTRRLRSPNMQAKIMTMMPSPEAAQRFLSNLAFEERSSELTTLALKGSPTARRMAQQADADTVTGDMILEAFKAMKDPTSISLWAKIFSALPKKARDTLRSRSDSALVDMLTTPEGAVRAGEEIPAGSSAAINLSAGPLAAGTGSAIGQAAGGASP